MATLTLVRHTAPAIDAGVCYGELDVDVLPSFAADAEEVIDRLPCIDLIVSSPLKRCRQLAALIADARACAWDVDARLSEMRFGRWEGRAWNDIPRAELDAWATDFLDAAPHGGESVRALNERVAARLAEDQAVDRSTLWVTHAGVIKSARFLASGRAADFDWQGSLPFGHALTLF